MIPYYSVVAIVIATLKYADGQPCNTPNGSQGECIPIFNCRSLQILFNKKNTTLDEAQLLKKSHCGFDGKIPKVCCPKNCSTPEGKPGECISIFSCPHLADMLKAPVLHSNQLYVKQSRCQSEDQYSVCCGSPPIKPAIGNCESSVTAFPPDSRTECCGRTVIDKVLSGPVTLIDQYPWLAIIEYIHQNKTHLSCGGALISGKYVLTAAYCVTGTITRYSLPINVLLGEYDLGNKGKDCVLSYGSGEDCTDGVISIPIERIIPHPDYNNKLWTNDIALIRMKQAAPFTDFIQPICLPTSDITQSPLDHLTFITAGWGLSINKASSNLKKHVNVPFQSLEKCQAAYNKSIELWDSQVCAGVQPGMDNCNSNSGGPLMFQNGQTTEIVGILSFGPYPCNKTDIPDVYTKVFKYVDWIRNSVEP